MAGCIERVAGMEIKMVLLGDPRTKKNSPRIVGGKYPKLLPSKAFAAYQDAVGWQIKCRGLRISEPVNIKAVFYMGTRRKVDLANLNSSLHDILVHYEVLADDNRDIVAATDGSRVLYDKVQPRVEVEITSLADYKQWSKHD